VTITIAATILMVAAALAGQHFAYRAGQHKAHADWCQWMAEGWLNYLATGDTAAAFGLDRPTPRDRR
jgi:hypothetical protein